MPYADKEKNRQCKAEWYQTVVRGRRLEWFARNGPCIDCGSTERLEVDHVDPAQKVSHRLWTWSQKRREEELAKCVARCTKCHDEKTRIQMYGERKHGTARMYQTGCRCNPCSKAKWQYMLKRIASDEVVVLDSGLV